MLDQKELMNKTTVLLLVGAIMLLYYAPLYLANSYWEKLRQLDYYYHNYHTILQCS